MSFSLNDHSSNYQLTYTEGFISLCTLSGAPYAKRHWELSSNQKGTYQALGHRLIAMLEAIPIIGGLAALLERVSTYAFAFFNKPHSTEEKKNPNPSVFRVSMVSTPPTPAAETDPAAASAGAGSTMVATGYTVHRTAMEKMQRNMQKAIFEHRKREEKDDSSYVSVEYLFAPPPLNLAATHRTLKIESYQEASLKGKRDHMEDVHFHLDIQQGNIIGVLDGHGGAAVADFVAKEFQNLFPKKLKALGVDVKKAFEEVFKDIQEKVKKNKALDTIGTTAVFSFIEKATNLIYTATLGDSEANIYRRVDGKLKSIPLSCVRDWSSIKDATRAANALEYPLIAQNWPLETNPKMLYFPILLLGGKRVNVSRAIGDQVPNRVSKEGVAAISHKPKVTVCLLQPDDLLIFACDGLKDYVKEHEIIARLEAPAEGKTLAQDLADYALNVKHSIDNITVLTARVC